MTEKKRKKPDFMDEVAVAIARKEDIALYEATKREPKEEAIE